MKVQKYDRSGTDLLAVYDSVRAAAGSEFSEHSIRGAARKRTVYRDARWFLVPADQDRPTEARDIGPTVETGTKTQGEIAMMRDGSVIQTFRTQKDAAECLQVSAATVCDAVKFGNLVGDGCQLVVRADGNRPRATGSRSLCVQRTDVETKRVDVFETKEKATRAYNMSFKTLNSVIASGREYAGGVWSLVT